MKPDKNQQVLDAEEKRSELAGLGHQLSFHPGWTRIVAPFVENHIKNFANSAILGDGFATMEKYQFERGIVEGMRRIVGEVDGYAKAAVGDGK